MLQPSMEKIPLKLVLGPGHIASVDQIAVRLKSAKTIVNFSPGIFCAEREKREREREN